MEDKHLIESLQQSTLYDHPVTEFKILETHISWVLLTGAFAYKIKKPVKFPFLDYSTLEKRQYFCHEEFNLNQKLAPELYLAVLPIYGSNVKPNWKGEGPIIEYAVLMQQFDQSLLFNHLIQIEGLNPDTFKELATKVAKFHLNTESSPNHTSFGTPNHIEAPMLDNFDESESIMMDIMKLNEAHSSTKNELLDTLNFVKTCSIDLYQKKYASFLQRKQSGFIRDCHGDLHLGNIVFFLNQACIFDRIEFNLDFRWIDTVNEIAFLIMDLEEKSHRELGFYFLNYYLQITGDFLSLELLPFYKIYRAMVRAKVAILSPLENRLMIFKHYLDYASTLCQELKHPQNKPFLIITSGLSGSGKTFLSDKIAAFLSCIHLRSDVERKRLFLASENSEGLYTEEKTNKTYLHLYDTAKTLLEWGYSVIVDAAFLYRKERHQFQQLADFLQIPFIILHCEAEEQTLCHRIQERLLKNQDASDATLEVLNLQIENQELLSQEELSRTLSVVTDFKHFDIRDLIQNLKKQLKAI